jgi:site-specific DNA recombinase
MGEIVTKRAVLYARVSTDDSAEHGYSIPTQLSAMRDYTAKHGFEVLQEITDDCSGAIPVFQRPGGSRVYELLQRSAVDVVLLYTLDRAARDDREYPVEYLIFLRDVQDAGAELHYVDSGPTDGGLLDLFRAWQAGDERRKIRERTMRGMRGKIRAGKLPGYGPAPLGYKRVGYRQDVAWVVDETEAEIVRQIYDWYGNGIGVGEISDRLTARRILTPAARRKKKNGKTHAPHEWQCGSIYVILHQEAYAGVFYAHRERMVWEMGKDGRKRSKAVPRPPEEWVPIEVPAIVDRKIWDKAQHRLERGRLMATRNTMHRHYLVRGRITCRHCHYSVIGSPFSMRGYSYTYYRCNGRSRRITSGDCKLPYFDVKRVDDAVWGQIVEWLQNPDEIERSYNEYLENREKENEPARQRLAALERELEEIRSRQAKLVELYLSEVYTLEEIKNAKAQMDAAVSAVEKEHAELARTLEVVRMSREQMDHLHEYSKRIGEGIAKADFATKRKIVDLLETQVELEYRDGARIAHVRCVLGEANLAILSNARWDRS